MTMPRSKLAFAPKTPNLPAWALAVAALLSAGPVGLAGQEAQKQRVVTAAAPVLEAMDAYMGHWRTGERTGPQGGTFHFEYELSWKDPGRTIADMLITQVMPDGTTNVVFEGVKGREPDGSGVYYWAVSPSGRASRGEVFLEGDRLITLYDGWTADGSSVQIRDVFMPVDGDGFDTRTYLRQSSEADWRQIGDDRWHRME